MIKIPSDNHYTIAPTIRVLELVQYILVHVWSSLSASIRGFSVGSVSHVIGRRRVDDHKFENKKTAGDPCLSHTVSEHWAYSGQAKWVRTFFLGRKSCGEA